MRMRQWVAWGAAAAALLATTAARAGEIQVEMAARPVPFPFPGPLWPHVNAAVDDRLEASAAEPIGDGRQLFVADDKTNALLVVDAETGVRIGAPLSTEAFPKKGAKWEAMARDDEGNYYIISAHTGGDAQSLAAQSYLLRFRLTGGGAGGAPLSLDTASVRRFDITEALTKAGLYHRADPMKSPVKIEGLAVRTLRDPAGTVTRRELVIGLREPDDPVTAYAADITTPPASGAELALRRLFSFTAGALPADGRGAVRSQLSSLEYVPAWGGFLVTTSSEDAENAYHGNTLWFLPDGELSPDRPARPQRVWLFGVGIKVEGLCLLPSDIFADGDALRLVLVYDNDSARTGKPSLLQRVTLVRWPAASPPVSARARHEVVQ